MRKKEANALIVSAPDFERMLMQNSDGYVSDVKEPGIKYRTTLQKLAETYKSYGYEVKLFYRKTKKTKEKRT